MVTKGTKMIVAKYSEKVKMHELLTKYLHQIEDTDMYRYEEGWNDERIALLINPKFGYHHTQVIRMEMFGKLKGRGNVVLYKTGGTLSVRMATIECQFRRLITYCGCNEKEVEEILSSLDEIPS